MSQQSVSGNYKEISNNNLPKIVINIPYKDIKEDIFEIIKTIQSKRRTDLDKKIFVDILQTPHEDIRVTRDPQAKADNIRLVGQTTPIVVNIRTSGEYMIVDGKTRYIAVKEILHQKEIDAVFYVGLTPLEEDLWNVLMNCSQTELSGEEKINFFRRNYKEFQQRFGVNAVKALATVLKLSEEHVKTYFIMTQPQYTPEIINNFVQKEKGYGRSDVNVEALKRSEHIKNPEALKVFSEFSKDRRENRKSNEDRQIRVEERTVAKRIETLLSNTKVMENHTPAQAAKLAINQVQIEKRYGSGAELPKNSENKYPIIDKLLQQPYAFSVILFSENLTRFVPATKETLDSETKRIIDAGIKDIIICGHEVDKMTEVESYLKTKPNINSKVYIEDVHDTLKHLRDDSRKGLIFVNGAYAWSQRPQFIQAIKKKYPNSTVAYICIDFFTGKSEVNGESRDRETLTVYGIVNYDNFSQVMEETKRQLPRYRVEFKEYAHLPQEKYITIVE